MLEALGGEGLGIVARLVEADDGGNSHLVEDVGVVGWREGARPARRVAIYERTEVHRPFESDKLARDHLL